MEYLKKLRNTLKVNATFSLLCGLDAIIFDSKLASLMGVPTSSIFIYIGSILALFGGMVFYYAAQQVINVSAIKFIILQDWLWVLGSVVILVLQLFELSFSGYELIFILAVIVGLMAILQMRYLRLSNP